MGAIERSKWSPALQMIRLCYEAGLDSTGLDRWKQRMNDAIQTAIFCGLEFHEDDYITIRSWHNQAWRYDGGTERLYSAACGVGVGSRAEANTGAAKAIEKAIGRKPLMYKGARLCVGAEIEDGNKWWHVGSIRDKEGYFNLTCQEYVGRDGNDQPQWKQRRRKVTFDEWKNIEKARKAAVKAAKVKPEEANPEGGDAA